MRLALLFPGQGAQYVGMGQDLLEAGAEVFEAASEALGTSVVELCRDGPLERLTRTLHAQPAVVAVSLAALSALRRESAARDIPLEPVVAAGHSVGELAAISAADGLDLETTFRLVVERATVMDRACAELNGGMAAVIGLEAALADQACRTAAAQSGEVVEAANFNAADQTVIAGSVAGLAAASAEATRLGARRVIPLKVAGPFHTSLMQGAADAFATRVRLAEFREARITVVLNGSAREATSPDALREELAVQIARPVRWADSMARVAALGIDAAVELGPGQVLSGLARRLLPGTPTLNLQDRATLTTTLYALARLRDAAVR